MMLLFSMDGFKISLQKKTQNTNNGHKWDIVRSQLKFRKLNVNNEAKSRNSDQTYVKNIIKQILEHRNYNTLM
jgi:hypothetical protein